MKKLIVKEINNYDYIFVDSNNKEYMLNIEFYTDNKPSKNDIVFIPDEILNEKNLFSFGDIYDDPNRSEEDMIKVVTKDGEYYLQRYYG